MEITSVSFNVATGDKVTFPSFQIFMGTCYQDVPGEIFEENYVPGTKTAVYDHTDVTFISPGAGEWLTVELDLPFWYNGTDNLLMEFAWPGGAEAIYVWSWIPEGDRTLWGTYDASSGNLMQESLYMRLNGSLAFETTTFAAVKATLGR